MKGRTISDQDRKIAGRMGRKHSKKLLNEGSRNISNADRARVDKLLKEAAKTISNADTLELNDGGMARKTRVF